MKSLKTLVLVTFSAISLGLTHPTPTIPLQNFFNRNRILIDLAQTVKIYNQPTLEVFGYNNEVFKGYKYELKIESGSFLYLDMEGEGLGSVGSNDGFGLKFLGREYGFIGFDGPDENNKSLWEDILDFKESMK